MMNLVRYMALVALTWMTLNFNMVAAGTNGGGVAEALKKRAAGAGIPY